MEHMTQQRARFNIGQVIIHKLFNYRGVIVDVDPVFQGQDEWYEKNALSRPPKDKPWYRVLVHNADQETYVAERNLNNDPSQEPVKHPLVDSYFEHYDDGYRLRSQDKN